MNDWCRRQLTPFVKIIILKTMVLSKLDYLLTVPLPDLSEAFLREVNAAFCSFLWNGKCAKIRGNVVCRPYCHDGLNMYDIYTSVAWVKINWIRRFKMLEFHVKSSLIFIWHLDWKIFKVGAGYGNVLLKHYNKCCSLFKVIDTNDCVSECIHYNVNITRDQGLL